MDRIICDGCKSRFYFDEEEDKKYGNKAFCSYCEDDIHKCYICNEVFFDSSGRSSKEVCRPCSYKHNTGFVTGWQLKRFSTFIRDNFKCRYCGSSPLEDGDIKLHCDHIKPKSKGGEDLRENLVTSCLDCNMGKIDRNLPEKIEKQIIERKELIDEERTDYSKLTNL